MGMWTASASRHRRVSQSCRTSSRSGRSLASRRFFRSWGVISFMGAPLPGRRAPDQKVHEPAVHGVDVLDLREVPALVHPANPRAYERLGDLGAMLGRD